VVILDWRLVPLDLKRGRGCPPFSRKRCRYRTCEDRSWWSWAPELVWPANRYAPPVFV